jgi:CBS domain containing-hemolysin-like protein
MSLFETLLTPTKTDASEEPVKAIVCQQLPRYFVYAQLGMVGGAIGVMLTIGLAVVLQALLPPTIIFSPSAIVLMTMAALISVGVSWLFGQAAPRLLPRQFYNLNEQGLQVILIFSVFASLLQTILFMNVL